MKKWPAILLCLFAPAIAGCVSNIQPLRPVQQVEVWVEDSEAVPETQAVATAPSTQPEADPAVAVTLPATRPGRMVLRTVDPNETSQFIYNASYDNVWRQGILTLTEAGFALDRQDYRLGVMTTRPLPSAQIVEFWRPHNTSVNAMMENTINNQRRMVKLSISKVEDKPEFYQIGIQVLVEREANPEETINGPIFVQGSGFGRNDAVLRSDYAPPNVEPSRWVIIGHDPELERKLINALFKRI